MAKYLIIKTKHKTFAGGKNKSMIKFDIVKI